MRIHLKEWTDRKDCRQSRATLPKPSKIRTKLLLQLSRKDIKNITSILTGHCILNKHLNTMKLSPTATCPKCELEEDTPLHHVGVCPTYNRIRSSLIPMPILELDDIGKISLTKLAHFLKATGRLGEYNNTNG